MLTQSRLKQVLHYSPESGEFLWIDVAKKNFGRVAGTKFVAKRSTNHIYTRIKVDKHSYFAHRLAFCFMTGNFPIGLVDHVDGNSQNDAWSNLREATPSQNNQNRKKTGVFGVQKSGGRFRADIALNGKKKYLGTFMDAALAFDAFIQHKRLIHTHCTI